MELFTATGKLEKALVINVCNHGEHYETPCIIIKEEMHEEGNYAGRILPFSRKTEWTL
jgi:hypothetical protein